LRENRPIPAVFRVAYRLLSSVTIGATPGRIAWRSGNDTPRKKPDVARFASYVGSAIATGKIVVATADNEGF